MVMMNDAAKKLIGVFKEIVNKKWNAPDNSLLGKLVAQNKNTSLLREEQMISLAIFLFIAGQETTSGLISNSILALLRNPLQLEMLRNDRTLTAQSIEETLRYDSTVQLLGRIAGETIQLHDKEIPAGATVTLVIGSANRDEQFFDQPDSFNINRKPNRHLAFGTGKHFCMGDWLARKIAQQAVYSFFTSFREIKLENPEIVYNKNLAIRTPTKLVVSAKR
jgi:pimeloyl-[acyl-carrier protein] synthase